MRTLALLAAMFFGTALAAEKQPGLELRIQSAENLSGYFEYFGGLAGQGEQGKQFAELLKAFGGAKGVIEGFDLKRPLGGYAVFNPGVIDSQFVVMIPVADEKAFVNLLKDRLKLDPKDEGDGLWKIEVPNVPVPLFARVHKDYACVSAVDGKNLDPKTLLDPKEFFAVKDDTLVSVQLHFDRIPAEAKKVVLGQAELKLADLMKQKGGDPAQQFGQWLAAEAALRSLKCLSDEGKSLALKLNVQPKSDDLTLVATVTAKDGSDFQKTLKSIATKPALAALAAKAEHPVVSLAINAGLPAGLHKEFTTKLEELLGAAKNRDAAVAGRMIDAILPTVKSGDYEFGGALTGEYGKLKLLVAAKAVEGKGIEKLAKELRGMIPEDVAKFEFDVETIALGGLHRVSMVNDDMKRYYGSETVWAAVGDSLVVFGIEEKGEETKRVASFKPGNSDMLAVKIGWTRFQPLAEQSLDPTLFKESVTEVFGDAVKPGADEFAFTVAGGEQLTIKFNVKGKLVEFLAKLEAKKKMR